jgi:hypothetical protein
MHNARSMRRRQSIRNLHRILQCLAGFQTLAPNHVMEGLTLDIFHCDEIHPSGRVDIVDVDDVGMVQRGGCFRLLHEPPLALGVRDPVGRQDLNRNWSVEMRVSGFVHQAHATAAQFCHETVVGNRLASHSCSPPGSCLAMVFSKRII